jgi:ABC-type transport system involved in cytochrome c biogenesis permease subunit
VNVIPEMVPVAFGTTLLGLGSASSVAAERVPRRARLLGRGSVILFAGAAVVFAILLEKRWGEVGLHPLLSRYEAFLQAAAGLSLGAAILAGGGSVGLRAATGAAVLGVGLGWLAYREDPEPLYSAPASQAIPAFLHFSLKWISFGTLLAAVGGAGARLLDRRTGDGVPEAWDAALHRVVRVGLPVLMASFLVGAVWHGAAWSAPFTWDAAETWTLVILLAFLGWLHFRQVAPPASKMPALLLLFGGLLMAGWWTYLQWAPGAVDSHEIYY